jgi:hypothetical protein
VRQAYDDFVSLNTHASPRQRLTSAGGYRYDYWRIAFKAFKQSPLQGLGAGNYPNRYVVERKNPDYVMQPHSLGLQLLAELGLVGFLGLAIFGGAVLVGGNVGLRRRSEPGTLHVRVACSGIFLAWLLHTNVDWLYNIPGVTGMALLAAAALIGSSAGAPSPRARPPGNAYAVLAMWFALAISASVGLQWFAERLGERARTSLSDAPAQAVLEANRSLELNPERLETYYVKSAAYARLDDYGAARAVLRRAVQTEPHAYVPWVLLGDLAVRRGDLAQARRNYRRASALNPFDKVLARQARQ